MLAAMADRADPGRGIGVGGSDSPGAVLRATREKQGLHIAALAAAIKVSPRKLEALEADRWSELPDATFIRALAQTVCRTLKIDPKPVLERLPRNERTALTPVDTAEYRPSPMGRSHGGRANGDGLGAGGLAMTPMVWGAGVLLVGALVLYFMPAGWWTAGSMKVSAPPAPAASAPLVVAPPPPPVVEPAASGPAQTAAVVELSAVPASPPVPLPVPPAPPAAAAPFAPAAALPSATPGSASKVVAVQDSWLEVQDARGSVLVSRLLRAGEALTLEGAAPLRLTVGNAAGTQLVWRGQPVDLELRTTNNVARLELP